MLRRNKGKSIMAEILLALVPYTKQNLLLIFKPNSFFDSLELTSGFTKSRLRTTYYRAKRKGIFKIENDLPVISLKGKAIIQPFTAKVIENNAKLMVIFDIPEDLSCRRQKFRNLLKQLKFTYIQQSVWSSNMDYREVLFESINDLEINDWVQLYESSRISKI